MDNSSISHIATNILDILPEDNIEDNDNNNDIYGLYDDNYC
jgi:hypothetical protein